jgi:hypothetical protein
MKPVLRERHIGIGLSLAFLLGGMGCVTTSDLDRLDQGLTRKVDGLGLMVRSEVGGLRSEQAAHAKRHQELASTLDVLKSTIHNDMDALHRQLGAIQLETKSEFEEVKRGEGVGLQIVKDLKAETATRNKVLDDYAVKIQGIRQSLSSFEQLPAHMTSLDTDIRTMTRILLSSYRLEETALRERLKTLEQLAKQLEPVTVIQQTTAPAR